MKKLGLILVLVLLVGCSKPTPEVVVTEVVVTATPEPTPVLSFTETGIKNLRKAGFFPLKPFGSWTIKSDEIVCTIGEPPAPISILCAFYWLDDEVSVVGRIWTSFGVPDTVLPDMAGGFIKIAEGAESVEGEIDGWSWRIEEQGAPGWSGSETVVMYARKIQE